MTGPPAPGEPPADHQGWRAILRRTLALAIAFAAVVGIMALAWRQAQENHGEFVTLANAFEFVLLLGLYLWPPLAALVFFVHARGVARKADARERRSAPWALGIIGALGVLPASFVLGLFGSALTEGRFDSFILPAMGIACAAAGAYGFRVGVRIRDEQRVSFRPW